MKKNIKGQDFFLKNYLRGKTAVFMDYANVKSWLIYAKVNLDLKNLYLYFAESGVTKSFFYYGTDPQNPKTYGFLQKVRSFGYEVITKQVRYYKINLLELFEKPVNKRILKNLNPQVKSLFLQELKRLQKKKVNLFTPKCNFDVEMSLDMIMGIKTYDTFIIFSGDGDFTSVVKFLRTKGRRVVIVAKRKFLAGSLIENCDIFINFDKLIEVKNLIKKQKYPFGYS